MSYLPKHMPWDAASMSDLMEALDVFGCFWWMGFLETFDPLWNVCSKSSSMNPWLIRNSSKKRRCQSGSFLSWGPMLRNEELETMPPSSKIGSITLPGESLPIECWWLSHPEIPQSPNFWSDRYNQQHVHLYPGPTLQVRDWGNFVSSQRVTF